MVQRLTLYTNPFSPYGQRVELALLEAKAAFNKCEVDLHKRPEWYTSKANPKGLIPAVAYGGSANASPESKPSPESVTLIESLIILEFVADLYPDSGLMPKDAILRAKIRLINDAYANKVGPAWYSAIIRGESFDGLMENLLILQDLFCEDGPCALGQEFTIADAAVLPFIARMEVVCTNNFGLHPTVEGVKAWGLLQADERFKRLKSWFYHMKTRESFKQSFDLNYFVKTVLAYHSANEQKTE